MLNEELRIKSAELRRLPNMNTDALTPTLSMEMDGEQEVDPIVTNLLKYLTQQCPNYNFKMGYKGKDMAYGNFEFIITSNENLQIEVEGRRKSSYIDARFQESGAGIPKSRDNREELIKGYISHLEN